MLLAAPDLLSERVSCADSEGRVTGEWSGLRRAGEEATVSVDRLSLFSGVDVIVDWIVSIYRLIVVGSGLVLSLILLSIEAKQIKLMQLVQ